MGYQGVEPNNFLHENTVISPAMLHARDLSFIGKCHPTYILGNGIEKEIERFKQQLDEVFRLGGEVVILVESTGAVCRRKGVPLTRRPIIREEKTWKELCEGLERMARLIHECGIISAYHHHMGTVIQSKQDIDKLMQGTEALGLLYDTGHIAFAQENLLSILQEYHSRITHVHIQSVSPSVLPLALKEDRSFFTSIENGIFTMPGEQEWLGFEEFLDLSPIIESLLASDYSGWIVIEGGHVPSSKDLFAYGTMGYEIIHSLLVQEEFRYAKY